MKKILPLLVIIFATQYVTLAQNYHLIDSLQFLLKTIKEDTSEINILLEIAEEYNSIQGDSCIQYAKSAYNLSVNLNHIKSKFRTSSFLRDQYINQGMYDKGLEYALQSIQFANESGNKVFVMNANQKISRFYSDHLKNLSKGLQYAKYALEIAKEQGRLNDVIENLDGISSIYFNNRKYDEALFYSTEGYKTALQSKDTLSIIWSLASVGDCYRVKKNYSLAVDYYNHAINLAKKDSLRYNLASLYNNLAVIYNQTEKKKAVIYYLLAIHIVKQQNRKSELNFFYKQISNTYLELKNYLKALEYNKLSLKFEQTRGTLPELKTLYLQNANINDSLKNYKQANISLNKYIAIANELQTSESQNNISKIEVALESEKRQKQIDLINKDIAMQKIIRNSFMIGFAFMLLFAGVFFYQRNKIRKEKKLSEFERERSDNLLLNILPPEVAEELKQKGNIQPKLFNEVTVMFTDFKDFSKIAETLSPSELVNEIDECFRAFDDIIVKYNIEKIKTIGDSYMCAGGLPIENTTNANDVVKAAIEMQGFIQDRYKQKEKDGKNTFEMRVGINTGAVVAGIVGIKKFAYDIWGDTVNIASRMESSGEAGKINISGSTYELVKTHFSCVYRGKIEAKNKGDIDMYFVLNA